MMADTGTGSFNWHAALDATYHELLEQAVRHAPQWIGAAALLLIGWMAAHLFRVGAKKTVQGLNRLFARAAAQDRVQQDRIKKSYAIIISQALFWAILVFFAAAAANLLGWNMFAGWMNSLASFLPRLLIGLLILLAGVLLGNAARAGILSAAHGAGLARGNVLARVAQIVILTGFVIVGVEQIGLNTHFLTNIVVAVTGILLAGAVLAFSLGARTMVENILGARYARQHCRVGEYMELGGHAGDLLEITQTALVLEDSRGRVVIPARLLHEQAALLNPEGGAESGEKGAAPGGTDPDA